MKVEERLLKAGNGDTVGCLGASGARKLSPQELEIIDKKLPDYPDPGVYAIGAIQTSRYLI